MNLFVFGISSKGAITTDRACRAITRFRNKIEFFPGEEITTWTAPSGKATFISLAHSSQRVGKVRYNSFNDNSVCFFSGRPIEWASDTSADGQAPLDPKYYARPASAWAHRLDGRFTAGRYADDEQLLELVTDSLGAYPVFATEFDGQLWISPNPWVLREMRPQYSDNLTALASLIGGGFVLSGDSIWSEVRRIQSGAIHRFRIGASPQCEPLIEPEETREMLKGQFDPAGAALVITESVRALADWPGRPQLVPATSGRDSRVVLAGAVAADFDFQIVTGGSDDDPDVVYGRTLAKAVGRDHAILAPFPDGSVRDNPTRGIQALELTSGATACLEDGRAFPLGPPRAEPMPLSHTGQGGEIVRHFYGSCYRPWYRGPRCTQSVSDALFRAFTNTTWRRETPLSQRGAELIRADIDAWVHEQLDAGIPPADLPQMFYIHKRMSTWAAPSHSHVEYSRDSTSPLWSRQLLAHMLALPRSSLPTESFHYLILQQLAPNLLNIEFGDGVDWSREPSIWSMRKRRLHMLARKGLARGLKQASYHVEKTAAKYRTTAADARPSSGEQSETLDSPKNKVDPFTHLQLTLKAAIAQRTDDPVWSLVDRDRATQLLEPGACFGHPERVVYAYRLAQVVWRSKAPQPSG